MKETLIKLYETLIKTYQKYLGLVFRVGLMITVINVWDSLKRRVTDCSAFTYAPDSEGKYRCIDLSRTENILRDFIGDLFPLVVFLSVFYVLFWFVKKNET